jgi:hypothetical protein
VLPFIGLKHPISDVHALPYMVSELAVNGTLRAYVKTKSFDPFTDPLRLVSTLDQLM